MDQDNPRRRNLKKVLLKDNYLRLICYLTTPRFTFAAVSDAIDATDHLIIPAQGMTGALISQDLL